MVLELRFILLQDWNMDESLGGMLKLTRPNYSVWKSKMRDMLLCKDLWLPVQCGIDKPEKIDAST